MKNNSFLVLVSALLITLALQVSIEAESPAPFSDPDRDRKRGILSTSIDCLRVDAGSAKRVSSTIQLEWEGQVDAAFLLLTAGGSQQGHSIYINDHRVAAVPLHPDTSLCQTGIASPPFAPSDRIPIPKNVLVQGENIITLTNDASLNDAWTAANLQLEINGRLSLPPAPSLSAAVVPKSTLGTTAIITSSVNLTSSYDGQPHTVWYQIPASYTPSISVPLVLHIHGMGGTGESTVNSDMAIEANQRGWLFAGPDMHGSYYLNNNGRRALAWPGAQHDILDAIEYMQAHYNVDSSHIYLIGGSMGGQTAAVMAAKYPDVFAAIVAWKGITDLADWHNIELETLGDTSLQSQIENETGGTPEQVPFEYARRSAMAMPQNMRLVPLQIWHDSSDDLVWPYHSYDLVNAVNNWNPPPPIPIDLIITHTGAGHALIPDPASVFDFLQGFTLDAQPPTYIAIRTDESKPYYWMKLVQTGGDHWTEVITAVDLANQTVTATISDTQPLTLALNLGSTPIVERPGISRAGMGLPATNYLIAGNEEPYTHDYISGYLTITVSGPTPVTVTVSALTMTIETFLPVVLAGQTTTSTITSIVQDYQSNSVPDGTMVEFQATEGTFPNGSSTTTATTISGQAQTVLSLAPAVERAEILARVGDISAVTAIDVISPAIQVQILPAHLLAYPDEILTYTYQISNIGDTTLTGIFLQDDNGTPNDPLDDSIICQNILLLPTSAQTCHRSVSIGQTLTNTATVTGQDLLSNAITDSDSVTVRVISPSIKLTATPNWSIVEAGDRLTYTYHLTNTGNFTLSQINIMDNNGSPDDNADDFAICTSPSLASNVSLECQYSETPDRDITHQITASARDPRGNPITEKDRISVNIIAPAVRLAIEPSRSVIRPNTPITYTYHLTNTGDVTLTNIIVTDDNGTPADSADDLIVCSYPSLISGTHLVCQQSWSLTEDTTSTASVTAQDLVGNSITDDDTATVDVITPAIKLGVISSQSFIRSETLITFTYRLTNTGDTTLTNIVVTGDNGTPKDSGDDETICTFPSLAPDSSAECQHYIILNQDTTHTSTVTAQDPTGEKVTNDQTTNIVQISPTIELVLTTQTRLATNHAIVTHTYELANTGDITLTNLIVVDDNGTAMNKEDDITACKHLILAPAAMIRCRRNTTVTQPITNTGTILAQDPLGEIVIDSDWVTLGFYSHYLPAIVRDP